MSRLVGILNYQHVKVAARSGVAPGLAAEQYHFLRVRRVNNTPDNIPHHVVIQGTHVSKPSIKYIRG
jgi:hypothetical protein